MNLRGRASVETQGRWWMWILPLAIILGVFYLYTIFSIFRLSFTDSRIGNPNFSYTLTSYRAVLTDITLWRVI